MFVLYRSVSELNKLDGHLLHLSPIFVIRLEKGDLLTFDRKKACYTKVRGLLLPPVNQMSLLYATIHLQ